MKTDYRVICCIVAWLCCAAVDCRKDWNNLDGNGLEDFGREYDGDDELSFLGKDDIPKVLKDDDDTCESKCGISNDQTENEDIKCVQESGSITCSCKKGVQEFDYNTKNCVACECGEKSTGCKFDGGNKICLCEAKFADKAGKCSDCDCGSNSDGCKFNGETKVCSCKKGYEDKDGTCEETKCTEKCGEGYEEKGIQCTTIDNGQVECKCKETSKGFDYTTKQCEACECGEKSTGCKFDGGNKICLCQAKFADKAGQCSDCYCGPNSNECKFSGEEKVCSCKKGYEDKDGTCEECDCGDGAKSCSFDSNGDKTCDCKDKHSFSKKDGKCFECDCGVNSTSCSYNNEGVKECVCKEKFSVKQGKCFECDCGEESETCRFDGTNKKCGCKENYGQKEGKCTVCDCGDGGAQYCTFEGTSQKCYCKVNHGLKDEKCKECDCGKGAKSCSFNSTGGQTCYCNEKFSLKDGKCHDCYCGLNSTQCKFEGDKKVCSCRGGNADKDGTCTACNCGDNSLGCKFEDGKKTCNCKPKYGEKNGICTLCECGDGATGCTFNGDLKTCKCTDKYADKKGKCEKCGCGENSKGCSFKEEVKTCECKKDYADNNGICHKDFCQIKCGCEAGSCGGDMECEGETKFKEDEVKCTCFGKEFDESLKKCRSPCKTNEDCKHGAQCIGNESVKFCKCPEGTSGDTCGDVDACSNGGKYAECQGDKGTCEFDVKTKSPVCKCEKGKELDKLKNYCVDKFCFEGNCKDKSTCEYDKETNTGYCVCPEGKYYDYQENRCKVPDKCLLKKTACKENEVCVEGECKCIPPNEKGEEDKCIRKFCKANVCFPGANCSEADSSCFCEEGLIFTGSRCEDKKCSILNKNYAEECNCPPTMERDVDTKKCVPKGDVKPCEMDCGFGLCVATNSCRCFPGAENQNKICVLKKSFCASGKLLNGSREQCNCTDKYKQAKDGKTCELVTCADESAQKACAQMGATCRMKWKGTPQFECECPNGYVMDKDRNICSDPCSIQKNIDTCLQEGKFCFNSNSKANLLTSDCRCPPPFTNEIGCLALDKNVHLLSGIPVVKKNYEMKNGIDHVLLNTHLIQSLAQTYSSAVFDYGYLYDFEVHGKEIICSVWVRFKQTASEQLKRLPFQAKQFTEGVCKDCDTDMYVWPPALPLSKKLDGVVQYKNLDLCSTAVKDKLCGSEASCNLKTGCYCPRGFRMLEYTGRFTADGKRIQRCEATTKVDLNECEMKAHNCSKNSVCVNVPGDFICQCKPGYWKENNYDKNDCQDLCAKKPCVKGSCSMKKDAFNCKCEPGYGGSRCDEKDVNFASAKKSTVVVGAVLGTILIVGIIAFLLYYRKLRKSSYSEDFMPAPSHAEMTERRPMRGVVNKSYE